MVIGQIAQSKERTILFFGPLRNMQSVCRVKMCFSENGNLHLIHHETKSNLKGLFLVRKIFIRCEVAVPFDQVIAGFNRHLLEALSPPLMKLRIHRYDGQSVGDRFSMQLGPELLHMRWEGLVSAAGRTPGTFWFEDVGVQLPFPLKRWKHKHLVRKSGTGTVIIDIVSFSTGNSILDVLCYPFLKGMFLARISKYQQYSFA